MSSFFNKYNTDNANISYVKGSDGKYFTDKDGNHILTHKFREGNYGVLDSNDDWIEDSNGAILEVPEFLSEFGLAVQTYRADFNNIDLNDTRQSGYSLYRSQFAFSSGATSIDTINVTGGELWLNGNGHLCTAGIDHNGGWVGKAFGGGGYFEADIYMDWDAVMNPDNDGWPAFWGMAIEHLFFLPDEQWPGQIDGYVHFIEPDIMEVMQNDGDDSYYTGAVHDWFGKWNVTCPPNHCKVSTTTIEKTRIVPVDTDWNEYHRFGLLWVPATDTSEGYFQHYFNREPIGAKISWEKFDPSFEPSLTRQPWTFGIADLQHLGIIINSGENQLMKVRSIEIWQESDDNNLVI